MLASFGTLVTDVPPRCLRLKYPTMPCTDTSRPDFPIVCFLARWIDNPLARNLVADLYSPKSHNLLEI